MVKFNVGDVVVTLEKCGWAKGGQGLMLAGAIGKVKAVEGDLLTVKFDKKQPKGKYTTKADRKNFVVRTSEVRLATAEEAATIAKKKAPVIPQVGDVVTFEGFDGEYRKVDRKAQAGDVVVFRENTSRYFTNGKPYKTEDGVNLIDDEGDSLTVYYRPFGRTPETVDVYEKVEAEYVPQEGDIVVVVSDAAPTLRVGDVGKIGEMDSYSFRVVVPGKENSANWQNSEDVRKATPAEVEAYEQALLSYEKAVAEASKPKLKAGDYVKFTKTGDYDEADITLGKPYKVFEDCCGELAFVDDDGDERCCPLVDGEGCYEVLSADEAKWAKIGRKVNELRKGDIVRVVSNDGARGISDGQLIEVTANSCEYHAEINGYCVTAKLVTPVDARFDV